MAGYAGYAGYAPAATTGGGGMSAMGTMGLAGAGIGAVGGILSGTGNYLTNKRASNAAKRTRRRATRAADPKRFLAYMKTYEPFIKRLMDPQRVAMSDANAMAEQSMLRSTDADAARYGLMGSGAHLEQRRATKMGRMAANTENTREMYLAALREAMGLSERAQDRKISAILNSPNISAGSPTGSILSGLGQGLMGASQR